MIMVKTEDSNGTIHLTPIRNGKIFLHCKYCGGLYPIPSLCDFMEDLGDEDYNSDVLDICDECMDKKCKREYELLRAIQSQKIE